MQHIFLIKIIVLIFKQSYLWFVAWTLSFPGCFFNSLMLVCIYWYCKIQLPDCFLAAMPKVTAVVTAMIVLIRVLMTRTTTTMTCLLIQIIKSRPPILKQTLVMRAKMMKSDSINMSLSQLKYGEVDSQQCLGHEVMKVLHDSQKNLKSCANAITSGT